MPPPCEEEFILAKKHLTRRYLEDAIRLLENVVAARRLTLGEKDEDRLAAERELARAYLYAKRVKEAIPLLERVVDVQRQTRDENDASRLTSEHELATAYLNDKRVKKAIEILERIVKSGVVGKSTSVFNFASEHELARAYLDDGRVKDAITVLEAIVKVGEENLAKDDPSRLVSEHELARAYLDDGRVKDAIRILEAIVSIENKTLNGRDHHLLASEHELARAYLKHGDADRAVPLLEHVVSVEEQALTNDDPDRIVSVDLLRHAYARARRRTPLHAAAGNGHLQAVKLLLESGADPSAPDSIRRTPLYVAAGNGHLQVVKLLLESGADPSAPGSSGQTPLHRALDGGHIDTARFLMLCGTDMAAADGNWRTPLHCVAERGSQAARELFCETGRAGEDDAFSTRLALGLSWNKDIEDVILGAADGWDAVRQLAACLPEAAAPGGGGGGGERTPQAYAWEVPDILCSIYAAKGSPGKEPPGLVSMPPWGPGQMYVELAVTAINTGSYGCYEFGACGELLDMLWPGIGLDALRIVAAAAFLRHCAGFRAESQPAHHISGQMDKDVYTLLGADCSASDGSGAQEACGRLQDTVLQKLFGDSHDFLTRPIFLPRTVSRTMFVINPPAGSDEKLSEAIAWICAALRRNPVTEETSKSGIIRVSRVACHNLAGFPVWVLCPLSEMVPGDADGDSCWTHLFSPGLVVPATVRRPWGKGLGMSFAMMARLAAAESFLWVHDSHLLDEKATESQRGYILGGLHTALVPIEANPDASSNQWHLEINKDEMIDPWSLESTKKKKAKNRRYRHASKSQVPPS